MPLLKSITFRVVAALVAMCLVWIGGIRPAQEIFRPETSISIGKQPEWQFVASAVDSKASLRSAPQKTTSFSLVPVAKRANDPGLFVRDAARENIKPRLLSPRPSLVGTVVLLL